ncbi:hypothetical protein YC2023_043889 [Brassica napus]
MTQYSDAVAEVVEEVKSSENDFLGCFVAHKAAEMIKEEEAQQKENDAQLNEQGETEEEDDPPLNEP